MEELTLIFRVILGVMFFSSGISKLKKMPEHFSILKDYRILPASLIKPFGWCEVIAEVAVGLLLLSGFYQSIAAWTTMSLLVVYTLAIAINLLRGRREISCGCGGVAGNHHLSWWLAIRNTVLFLIGGWLTEYTGTLGHFDLLFSGVSLSEVIGGQYWITLLIGLFSLLFYMSMTTLFGIGKRIESLLPSR
ncbi:MauE/DoxX family redox-associated membrane protein [Tumebacillus lipolyticus]|uniref:MauE/DoxX family redox-associated membrane protein n=1 Tax=Tumebacillus lipolyticus TaxID=1280370 RepID=A0ABW4ZZR9_9BACL